MNPSGELVLLRERLAEVLGAHGLELWQLMVVPDDESRMAVRLIAGQSSGDVRPDDGFDQVIASARLAEVDLRAQESVDELTRRLRRGGGFLDPETE